jgi:hypothetical protein
MSSRVREKITVEQRTEKRKECLVKKGKEK